MKKMSKYTKSDIVIHIVRGVFLAVMAALILFVALNWNKIDVETILAAIPQGKLAAAASIILLYSLKSLSIFFPITILQIVTGYIFPIPIAIFINLLGATAEIIIPFTLSRYTSSSYIQKTIDKKPRIKEIIAALSQNEFFLSFFLRVLGFLPIDIVSMVLGMMKLKHTPYIAGSLLGLMPGIVMTSLIGDSAQDPSSNQFIVSIIVMCAFSLVTTGLYIFFLHRKKRAEESEVRNEVRSTEDVPAE